jgi:hypothetical protein
MRNALSASLILLSTVFISKKEPLKFYLTVFLAAGIQAFSVIALPLYVLHNSRFRNFLIVSGLILALVVPLVGGFLPLMMGMLESFSHPAVTKALGYYENSFGVDAVKPYGLGNLFRYILIFYVIIFLKDDVRYDRFSAANLTVFAYGVGLYTILSSVSIFSFRANEAFTYLPLAILFPFVVSASTAQLKIPIYMFIIAYCLFFMKGAFYISAPYQNLLLK